MGYMSALGMAEATDLDSALSWHFQANCFPPIPQEMIPVAKEAIEAIVDEDPQRLISLRGIVEWRDQDEAPAWAINEHLRLDAFIEALHRD